MKKFLSLLFLLMTLPMFSQTIKGSICFENEPHSFLWIGISTSLQKTQCDSLGHFQLNYATNSDILEIHPIPIFFKVRFIHLPNNLDTIELKNIPVIAKISDRLPMINFKNKQSSKKFFKKFEAQQREEEKALEAFINNGNYHWNGKEYPLRLERTKESGTIYIDLKE